MKRRTFLIGSLATVGGLYIGYGLYNNSFASHAKKLVEGSNETLLGGWVKIGEDNEVTVYIPHLEMGQGSHTALATLLAEELDADWSKVTPVHAPADSAFANRFLIEGLVSGVVSFPEFLSSTVDGVTELASRMASMQQTGGSFSVRTTGLYGMRVVGAAAREMLIKAAAGKLDVREGELTTADSYVVHASSNRKISYGELAALASGYSVSSTPKLKEPKDFKLVGTSVARLDTPAKVDGSFKFGIDLDLPNMRYAVMKASPVHGGKLESAKAEAAMKVSGVEKVINLGRSVVVVGRGFWEASKGLEAAAPRFSGRIDGAATSAEIREKQRDALRNGERTEKLSEGDVAAAIKASPGAKVVEAEYHVPYLHHAAMEPINVTAQFKDNHLTVWAGSQNPLAAKGIVAGLAGLDEDQITFVPQFAGGAFGRRGTVMAVDLYLEPAVEAARQMAPHPVKLIWSREEDFAQGCFRPQLATTIKATLDEKGLPVTWSQVFVDGRPLPLAEWPIPYSVPNQLMEAVDGSSHVRTGSWRSVNYSQHGFWTESFVDECAHAAGIDPLEYRRRMLPDGSRHRHVLDVLEEKANWKAPASEGVGRGVALVEAYGSIVAHVVEVAPRDGEKLPSILKVTSVVDCGLVVNPEVARQQIEGGVLMGLGSAMEEEITIENGEVVQQNFPDYQIMTLAKTPPEIDVHFVNSNAHWGGLGEPGLPPAAPALANAIFALTGKRMTATPFSKQL